MAKNQHTHTWVPLAMLKWFQKITDNITEKKWCVQFVTNFIGGGKRRQFSKYSYTQIWFWKKDVPAHSILKLLVCKSFYHSCAQKGIIHYLFFILFNNCLVNVFFGYFMEAGITHHAFGMSQLRRDIRM